MKDGTTNSWTYGKICKTEVMKTCLFTSDNTDFAPFFEKNCEMIWM